MRSSDAGKLREPKHCYASTGSSYSMSSSNRRATRMIMPVLAATCISATDEVERGSKERRWVMLYGAKQCNPSNVSTASALCT